jgi:hypothetical protein
MTNEKRFRLTALMAIVAIAPAALAQGGGGQHGQGGHGGQGMRQGGPGMMHGPAILFRQDVQRELKLTEEQIGKLREAVPGPGGPGGLQRGGHAGGGGQRQQGGPPQGMRGQGMGHEGMQKADAAVKGVLSDSQYKRYHELDLQLAGAMAVARPDVAEKLKLTEDQLQQIRSLGRPQGGPGGFQRGGQGGPPQGFDPAQMDKARKEQDEKILALLTDAQLVQWHQMLGKKFEFEKMGPPAGGHRGGGN